MAVTIGAAPPVAFEEPPQWAYPVTPPDFKFPPKDGSIRKVPDSKAGYTRTQVSDPFWPPNWHPEDPEFRNGFRSGKNAALMKKPVAGLSQNDMLPLAAYLASLRP
jgi:hypothetical protein